MMVAQSREEEVEGRGELVFGSQEKRLKPLPDSKSLKCPRCDSTNTKFCYYNNYSLSQPRYFCKGCRRYWTQGGSLRNVPVGGGCRKNKRCSPSTTSSTSSSSSNIASAAAAAAAATACNNNAGQFLQHHPTYEYDPSDLSLAFGRLHTPINPHPPPPPPPPLPHPTTHYEYGPFVIDNNSNANPIIHHSPAVPGFLDILRGGFFDPSAIAAAGHTNFFYGLGLGGNVEGEEESFPFLPIGEICSASPPPPVKQESSCKSSTDGGGVQQNWLVGGVDGANNNNNNMAGLDSGRDYYWSSGISGGVGGGGGAGVWHGLVNSSLM